MLYRAVVFRIDGELPPEARWLMEDFRLAVNRAVRAGLQAKVTSRCSLTKMLYKDFRLDHPGMYAKHLVCSFEVAASLLKNLRRRLNKGMHTRVPYVRRLMMKAENQAYKLDRENGVLDLPIRGGCHVRFKLVLSDYHRRYLDDLSLSLGSLTLLPDSSSAIAAGVPTDMSMPVSTCCEPPSRKGRQGAYGSAPARSSMT